jgi:hypothetical protein
VNRRPRLIDVGLLVLAVLIVANLMALGVLFAHRPDPFRPILPRATDPAPILLRTR